MLCIVSPTTDPFFNLAAEEYLFKNTGEDVFFLYINSPSVVVGKHQNAMAEINPVFVYENDIKVIRRMSGGGAVYHDNGNINFSFHKRVEDTAKVSFKNFNIPIVNLLRQLGVPAEISNRNDILVNGMKVSGHAQHVFRNKVLSHGTLLIDSDLEKLSNALRKIRGIYESKAIQSVRSKVANISGFIAKPLSANEFLDQLNNYIIQTVSGAKEYQLNNSEFDAISELTNQKYSTWTWNFGYSPAYRFTNELVYSSGKSISCILTVEKGLVQELNFEGNALTKSEKGALKMGLIDQPHQYEFFINFIKTNLPISTEPFINLFF